MVVIVGYVTRSTSYCSKYVTLRSVKIVFVCVCKYIVIQCFSTAVPRPSTGPWHQLYRAARGFPGICYFSFLSIFHEWICYIGNILRRIIFVNVSKSYNTTVCYKISLVQWLITNLNVILYLSTCHNIYVSVLIIFMIMP